MTVPVARPRAVGRAPVPAVAVVLAAAPTAPVLPVLAAALLAPAVAAEVQSRDERLGNLGKWLFFWRKEGATVSESIYFWHAIKLV